MKTILRPPTPVPPPSEEVNVTCTSYGGFVHLHTMTPKLCTGYDARYAMRRVAQTFPAANPRNLVHPRLCVILEKEE